MILDFHAHIKRNQASKQYLVDDFFLDMDQNNIDIRMVSALEGRSIKDQNDFIADLVSNHAEKLLGCAVINPKEDDALMEMERISKIDAFCAVEFNSLEHGYLPEKYPVIDDILAIIKEKGMVVKVFTGKGFNTMPGQWAYYSDRHPDVSFVILHMGASDFGYGCINLVEKRDNLFVETSNQYELPIFRQAFSRLPSTKFLFGSNYPTNLTYASKNMFNVLNLNEELLDNLFYKNAERLLGLN